VSHSTDQLRASGMRGGQRSRCYHPLAATDAAIMQYLHVVFVTKITDVGCTFLLGQRAPKSHECVCVKIKINTNGRQFYV